MIKSMTGFGSADLTVGAYFHRVEIRSVNGKFCDIKVKSPADMSWMELDIKAHLKSHFVRGHIEVLIFRESGKSDATGNLHINWDLAEDYHKAYQSIRHKFGIKQDASLAMMTNAREVITIKSGDEEKETTWLKTRKALNEAVESVVEMRTNEGKSLAIDLAGRCDILNKNTHIIGELAPQVVEQYKQRLSEKIAQISSQEIDDARLAQEICYFADRCDITEEQIRLRSHFQQFLQILESDDAVGRKLDFLVQEMNREANTIGSKSNSTEISHLIVEIKSEIEKLREQIQNVE